MTPFLRRVAARPVGLSGKLATGLVAAGVIAAGCGAGPPERSDVLIDLADEVIVPAFERFAADSVVLESVAARLCSTLDTDDLLSARWALSEARSAWSFSEVMWVGPVMERRSWAVIDWPIDAEQIEALIADADIELDFDRLARRIGADQRGLGAVELMLGAPGAEDAVLAELADERRCRYLTGIAEVIAAEAALLPGDWTVDFEDGGEYRAVFADPDGRGLDDVVNATLFLLEAITDIELAAALGEMGRSADPSMIVEGPAGLGVADLASHLEGVRAVLTGPDADSSAGLSPLLGGDLTKRAVVALDGADAAIAAIDPPLREAAASSPETVAAAREALKAVQVIVATEVVSRLGVTIGFSDTDGDTGA